MLGIRGRDYIGGGARSTNGMKSRIRVSHGSHKGGVPETETSKKVDLERRVYNRTI